MVNVLIVSLADKVEIDIVNKLVPNLWSFLTQLLAFIVMALIVIKFAYKPVSKYIQTRKDFVSKNLDDSIKAKNEAEDNLKKSQDKIDSSIKEASNILSNAKKQAEINKSDAENKLKKELALKRQQALKELDYEKEKAIKDAKDEIIDIAISASSSLLKKDLNKQDSKKVVDDYISSLDEVKDGRSQL